MISIRTINPVAHSITQMLPMWYLSESWYMSFSVVIGGSRDNPGTLVYQAFFEYFSFAALTMSFQLLSDTSTKTIALALIQTPDPNMSSFGIHV